MEEHNGLLFSVWYFAYELASRTLKFCAAGHHPSFMVTAQNPDPAPLWLKSPVIGMLPFGKWASGSAVMPAGARLFVFSDGAFEIVTADGHAWGMEDLRILLQEPAIKGIPEPQRLYQAVREASKPGPLDDDFSVLMVTFV
jgi:serine phosphatase RsbU (regulator of sigma subunit)